MLRKQPLTAIVPVRSGSKGVPGKNLYRLGRDTLLERTIKLAKSCSYIDRIVVSTDHLEMFGIAQKYGVAMKALRPAELATDTARTVDVVKQVMEAQDVTEGFILLLQVTSPFRTLADLNLLCETFETAPAAEAIVSLAPHDSPHPDKIQQIEDGYVKSYLNKESEIARQQLPRVYQLNGAFYLTHRETLLSHSTFMPAKTIPFLMPEERSLNLDSKLNLILLEALVEKGYVVLEEYDNIR